MGMFDNVYVDSRILKDLDISCPECKEFPKNSLQTKDFNNLMEDYYLAYDENKAIRLFKLDEPHDKRFWHTYTKEEIEKMRQEEKDLNQKNKIFLKSLHDMYIESGGHWTHEAYLPENRRKRDMGELPHQICNFYDICSCKGKNNWIEVEVKFTDGVAVSVIKNPDKVDNI